MSLKRWPNTLENIAAPAACMSATKANARSPMTTKSGSCSIVSGYSERERRSTIKERRGNGFPR